VAGGRKSAATRRATDWGRQAGESAAGAGGEGAEDDRRGVKCCCCCSLALSSWMGGEATGSEPVNNGGGPAGRSVSGLAGPEARTGRAHVSLSTDSG
jgi:hypothetical protein